MKNKIKVLCTFLMITAAIGLFSQAHAYAFQSNLDLNLIYEAQGLELNYWDTTSRYLYFSFSGVRDFIYDTYRYTVISGNPQDNITSIFQESITQLTTSEAATFGVRGDVYFVSPNGKYVIYLGPSNDTSVPGELWIGDRTSKITHKTGFTVYANTNPSVRWNTKSNLFGVIQSSQDNENLVGYGYIPGDNLNQAKFEKLEKVSALGITYNVYSNLFFPQYALSPDGSKLMVLLKSTDEKVRIAIIPSNSIKDISLINGVDAVDVKELSFNPNDASKVWFLTSEKFVEYNMLKQSQALLLQTSQNWIGQASFSPDGHWLSLLHRAAFNELYVVNLFAGSSNIQASNNRQMKKLQITSICSPKPNDYRLWTIHNANNIDLSFEWSIVASELSGTLSIKANGDVDLQTPKAPHNIDTLLISINGVYQDQRQSIDETPASCTLATATQQSK